MNYNKLTKQELIKLAEDRDKGVDQLVEKYENTLKDVEGKFNTVLSELNNKKVAIKALTDLVDIFTDTKALEGLNETQINTDLFRKMKLIKYTISKL